MAATKPARRILVPVDFTPRSHRLLRYAGALAAATKGEVSVLHVSPGPAGLAPDDAAWSARAVTTVQAMVERARLDPATPVHVLHGGVADEIGRFASTHAFDLVILGARPRPGWNGSLLGGTASAVVQHARVPVLVVPAAAPRAAA